jgi:hypothetical protein
MKQTMSRLIFRGWLALIALLRPLDASAQPPAEPFWNVDIGIAGTFTPVGGSDPVSSHRFSIGFGVDVLAGHSVYSDGH